MDAPKGSAWWRTAALSLGAATALALAVHRTRRHGAARAEVLVVVAPGDAAAGRSAKAYSPGKSSIVAASHLSKTLGGVQSMAIFCSDVAVYGIHLDMSFLQQCLEKLVPGGIFEAQLGGLAEDEAASLETTGLFAGAVESKVVHLSPPAGGRLSVKFTCQKPTWAAGAAAELPGSVKRINEDELLGELPAPVGKGKSDCSTAPKACANCNCGRKELEDKVGAEEAKKQLEQGKQRSACGSCYLGDAFRCETCPYRGLPAFKPGTKVELSSGETEGTGQFGMRLGDVGGEATKTDGGKLLISAS